MTTHIKVAGAWKAPTPYIKTGGAWKAATAIYIKVGGVWKQVYTSGGGGGPATTYTVTVASTGSKSGAWFGFSVGTSFGGDAPNLIGTCLPSSDPDSHNIRDCCYRNNSGGTQDFVYSVNSTTSPGSAHFTKIRVFDDGDTSGYIELLSSAANFTFLSNTAKWRWIGVATTHHWQDDATGGITKTVELYTT